MTPKNNHPSHTGAGFIRVIGGQWRGRKIKVPAIEGLRPTPDRVRETLFNWLAPSISGARCLDLFSGSGALSIEALSRGASHATAIDQSMQAVRELKNTSLLLKTTQLDIVQANAIDWLTNTSPTPFDIIFLDPPFHQNLITPCCRLLESRGWLTTNAAIYIEHEQNLTLSPPDQWECYRQQAAGEVSYTLYQRKG